MWKCRCIYVYIHHLYVYICIYAIWKKRLYICKCSDMYVKTTIHTYVSINIQTYVFPSKTLLSNRLCKYIYRDICIYMWMVIYTMCMLYKNTWSMCIYIYIVANIEKNKTTTTYLYMYIYAHIDKHIYKHIYTYKSLYIYINIRDVCIYTNIYIYIYCIQCFSKPASGRIFQWSGLRAVEVAEHLRD
jgi:hypothetical protein